MSVAGRVVLLNVGTTPPAQTPKSPTYHRECGDEIILARLLPE